VPAGNTADLPRTRRGTPMLSGPLRYARNTLRRQARRTRR